MGLRLRFPCWTSITSKAINDTYGHIAGDEVLRNLAIELRDHIRHPDTIGRYGGEEFLIVVPHSTIKAATEQAERLCRHVRSLTVINRDDKKHLLDDQYWDCAIQIHKEDWQEFLSRADSALYQAKNNGTGSMGGFWGIRIDEGTLA